MLKYPINDILRFWPKQDEDSPAHLTVRIDGETIEQIEQYESEGQSEIIVGTKYAETADIISKFPVVASSRLILQPQ